MRGRPSALPGAVLERRPSGLPHHARAIAHDLGEVGGYAAGVSDNEHIVDPRERRKAYADLRRAIEAGKLLAATPKVTKSACETSRSRSLNWI